MFFYNLSEIMEVVLRELPNLEVQTSLEQEFEVPFRSDYPMAYDRRTGKLLLKGSFTEVREKNIDELEPLIRFHCRGYFGGYKHLSKAIATRAFDNEIFPFMKDGTIDLSLLFGFNEDENKILMDYFGFKEDEDKILRGYNNTTIEGNVKKDFLQEFFNRENSYHSRFYVDTNLNEMLTNVNEAIGRARYHKLLDRTIGKKTVKEIITMCAGEKMVGEILKRGDGGWGITAFHLAQKTGMDKELEDSLFARVNNIYQVTYATALDFFQTKTDSRIAKELAERTVKGLKNIYDDLLFKERKSPYGFSVFFEGSSLDLKDGLNSLPDVQKYGGIRAMYDKCHSDLKIARCITASAAAAVWKFYHACPVTQLRIDADPLKV